MSVDSQQPLNLVQRRRAAYKALSEVLQGEQLLQAMWMIEDRDNTANKFTFLGIVGVTAEIFDVDNQVISSLYIKLDKYLDLPSNQLPPDPMDEMFKLRVIDKTDNIEISTTSSSIFKSNNILDDVKKELDNKTLRQIGQALASEVINQHCSSIILARDDYKGSIEIAQDFAKGIMSTGLNVIDLCKVPLPVLNFVTHHFEGKTGVMITGGHQTKDLNGLKMIVAGKILTEKSIQTIKQRIDNNELTFNNEAGSLEQNISFVNEYKGIIIEDTPLNKKLKIAIEDNNGTVNQFISEIFHELGCEIIKLDKDCFIESSETDSTLLKHHVDIGFTFDSQGARLRVFDNLGNCIRADQLMMFFAKDILASSPQSQIIHDTLETSNLATFIKQHSGQSSLCKKGSTIIQNQIKQTGAKFAGDMHGHIYFNDRWFGFDDAIYAACRFLQLLSYDTRKCHEIFSEFPDSFKSSDLTVSLSAGEYEHIVTQLKKLEGQSVGNISDMDGMRIDFKNGWMSFRADQTSSSLFIHFMANHNDVISHMRSQLKQLLIKISPDIKLSFK